MKLEMIVDQNFKSGFSKLVAGNIPMVSLFKLEDIFDGVNTELTKFEKVRQAALKKYAKTKKDGSFLVDEDGQVKFKSPEDETSYHKEYAELVAMEVPIEQMKGSIQTAFGDLTKIGVSLNLAELKALKNLFEV